MQSLKKLTGSKIIYNKHNLNEIIKLKQYKTKKKQHYLLINENI